MLIFSLTKLTPLSLSWAVSCCPSCKVLSFSLLTLLPLPPVPLAMCVSDSVFNLISIGLVSALYRAWCKAIEGNEKSSVSSFSLGIFPSSYSVHTVSESTLQRGHTLRCLGWCHLLCGTSFTCALLISLWLLWRLFYLQRTWYALLLAIFYSALPQPHKAQYCYCWMWFRKKSFANDWRNSLWTFQSFIHYRNYPESRILWVFVFFLLSIQQKEPLTSEVRGSF